MALKHYILLVLPTVLLLNTSCFTITTFNKAKYRHPDEKITKIESAYTDDNDNIYVNFRVTPDSGTVSRIYYLKTNLAIVKNQYRIENYYDRVYLKGANKRRTKIIRIENNHRFSPQSGINLVCKNNIYRKKRFANFSKLKPLKNSQFIYNYYGDYKTSIGHPSFAYFPTEKIIIDNRQYDYYIFEIRKIRKGKNAQFALLPLSVVADVVTAPVQVLVVIVGYTIEAIKGF